MPTPPTRPFDLVLAYAGDEPVGQAWGWPEDDPDAYAISTFSVAEIMVRRGGRGRESPTPCTTSFSQHVPSSKPNCMCGPENENAYRAYLKWGWRKAGEVNQTCPALRCLTCSSCRCPSPADRQVAALRRARPAVVSAPHSCRNAPHPQRAERELAAAGILGVAHPDGPADAGDLHALVPGVAVA